MTHTTAKQELFVTLVTTVNNCHKEIYYRYYRDPRYASEISIKLVEITIKSLKMIKSN